MQLSDAQLTQFRQDGFLLLKAFASPQQCDALRLLALKHLEQKIAPLESEVEYASKSKKDRENVDGTSLEEGETVRRLRQVYERDAVFKAWMEEPKIRPILRQILNDTPVLTLAHHNSIMTKMPHSSTQTMWHQDFRYWHFSDSNLVSVWLALDSEDEYNGALEFIPSSHTMTFKPEQFDKKEYLLENETNAALIETKVSHRLNKGDVVLFHCKTLHRANKNSTDKAKISFVYTVKGEKTKAKEGTRSASCSDVVFK